MFEKLLVSHLNLLGGILLTFVFYVCTTNYVASHPITHNVSKFSESTRARPPRFPDLGIPGGQGQLTSTTGLEVIIMYTYTHYMSNTV